MILCALRYSSLAWSNSFLKLVGFFYFHQAHPTSFTTFTVLLDLLTTSMHLTHYRNKKKR
nr:MAG TPA: hypothetical protein [Caudoviricetes sp.]